MQRSFPVWASCSKSCCVPTHGPRVQPCETEQVTHTALSHPLLLTASNRGKGRTKAQSQDPKLNRIWLKYNIRLSALTIASLMAPHLTTASQETSSMIMTLPPIYLFFSCNFFFLMHKEITFKAKPEVADLWVSSLSSHTIFLKSWWRHSTLVNSTSQKLTFFQVLLLNVLAHKDVAEGPASKTGSSACLYVYFTIFVLKEMFHLHQCEGWVSKMSKGLMISSPHHHCA